MAKEDLEAKRALVAELVALLRADKETMDRAARAAHEAATHEESRPENDKDTRGLEAAYLAGAQAGRVRDLELAAKMLEGLPLRVLGAEDPISASAVVTLEDEEGGRAAYFFLPHGGGARLQHGETALVVVTPQSPLGRALLGKAQGDSIPAPGKRGELVIVDVW